MTERRAGPLPGGGGWTRKDGSWLTPVTGQYRAARRGQGTGKTMGREVVSGLLVMSRAGGPR